MRQTVTDKASAIGLPLLGVALLAALAIATAHAATDPGGAVLTSSTTGRFAIKGNVAGLYPGGTRRLIVTVSNRNGFPIRVTSIRVKVGSAAGCPATSVFVKAFRGKLRVGAKWKRRLFLPVTMRASAPPACMGARLKLTYSGKAVKA